MRYESLWLRYIGADLEISSVNTPVTTQHFAEREAKNSSPVGADNRAGFNSRPVRAGIRR